MTTEKQIDLLAFPKPDCPNIYGGAYSAAAVSAIIQQDRAQRQAGQEPVTTAIRLITSASVVIGNLPERPGYNGSILQIDDEEAERIVDDLDRVIAMLQAAPQPAASKGATHE